MHDVLLHVYDVANSDSVKVNNAIIQINKIFKDGIGLGGIFHSAIEVYDGEEWSFGYCESGTGVFCCSPKKNPMYVYRESLSLGNTCLSRSDVKEKLYELRQRWQGFSYDLLSRNCNHFCNDFATELGVERIPAWVNRFANAGETAIEVKEATSRWLRIAKTEVVSASRVAYRTVFGDASSSGIFDTQRSPTSETAGVNVLQIPFIKTPVSLSSMNGRLDSMNIFSKMGIGARPTNGNIQAESSPNNNRDYDT